MRHEFNERFFIGTGCTRPNENTPFEECGAPRRTPQTAIIEFTLAKSFRFEIEGLKGGGWGRSLSTLCSIQFKLEEVEGDRV
jgi:hypothetical protein